MNVRKQIRKGLALACCLALALSMGVFSPTRARAEMADLSKPTTYSGSGNTVGVVDRDGSLWMWGANGLGQLGNGGAGNDVNPNGLSEPCQTVPVKVMEDVVSVCCSENTTAAIKKDGSLWMWGDNSFYQIGNGGKGNDRRVVGETNYGSQNGVFQSVPVKVMDGVAAVSCGKAHTAAIKKDGSLWMWGDNTSGALGNDRKYDIIKSDFGPNDRHVYQSVPVKVMENVAAVSCNGYVNSAVTAVIKKDGSLWVFGGNSYDAVGNGGGGDVFIHNLYWAQTVPYKVLENVAEVYTDGAVTYAVQKDHSLWAWGGGVGSGIGSEEVRRSAVPCKILENVAHVDRSTIMKTDGSVWRWGYLIPSESGPSREANSHILVLDGGIAAAAYENAVVKTDGSLWVWGYNQYGQLGIGSRETSYQMVQVPGIQVKLAGSQQPAVRPEKPAGQFMDSGSASLPKLTKQEMAEVLAAAATQTPADLFVTAPSCAAPYSAGQVKKEVLDMAANRLSALRRIAGLPAVTADPALCEQAQYGAVLLAASDFSHFPQRPGDMDSGFYAKGRDATSSSNIYGGSPLMSTLDGFMDDSDAGNVAQLGHRRWQLNPGMGKVGFGYAVVNSGYRCYTAEKVFDSSGRTTDYDFISWPASGNFPSDLSAFQKDTAWSVSVNPSRYRAPAASDLTVTLTRESDGKTWAFSGRDQYTQSGSGLYFNVDTGGYGISNCIIFRPDGISKYEGVYTVQIDGLRTYGGSSGSLSYQVDFFRSKNYKEENQPEQSVKDVLFRDVKEGDWFKQYVEKAAAAGLVEGSGGKYNPYGDLYVAQALVLAYQIDSQATGGTLPAAGGAWYMPYYQYCLDRGIVTARQVGPSHLTERITRYEMVAILDRAVPDSRMEPVKTVASIPDVAEDSQYGPVVYKWYRAGILSGGSSGSFRGNNTITRAEVAVILCQLNGL